MTEFVGFRAKMYALGMDGMEDSVKAKDVKNNVVARTILFDDYTRYLNEEIEMIRPQSCIRSKLHVYMISESKIILSPYGDKRYIVHRIRWRDYREGIGGYLRNVLYYVFLNSLYVLLF